MSISKIVIKIKDAFFLQNETFVANPAKVVIDDSFFDSLNFDRVKELYPMLKTAGNISESKSVFSNLIVNIAPLDLNGQLKSLFFVTDSTNVVNLMQMANDRSSSIGENLLNYYFIEVASIDEMNKLENLNKLKLNLPNLGIDYFYLRGTLANFEQQNIPQKDVFSIDKTKVQEVKQFSKMIESKFQQKPLIMNMMASSSKKMLFPNPENQANVSLPLPLSTNTQLIQTIFKTFGISVNSNLNLASTSSLKPTIKVIDMEQGWVFDTPITYVATGFPNKTILGGGINNSSENQHGQKTLNVLLGQENPADDIATLNGLCKGADVQVASTHYTQGEFKEAALASVLGYGYNITRDKILASTSTILNLYDIVLLELQISKTYKVYPVPVSGSQNASALFPVEIEPAMWNVIQKGVKAKYIIVEAAGNGNINLNTFYVSPFSTMKDLSSINNGTGAIMIGAFDVNIQPKLNNGNRINYRCFGDDVNTSALISTSNRPFNNTSLASAITAALIANFQSIAQDATNGIGRRLTIAEIIRILNYTPPSSLPANFKALLSFLNILP